MLPPSVDASVLDGGKLVSVETQATTHRDGQMSVHYTIVAKRGGEIATVQPPAFNTTDLASVLRTDAPLSNTTTVSELMDRSDLCTFLVACVSSTNAVDSSPDSSSDGLLSPYARSQTQGFSAGKVRIALHVAHALTYLHSLQPRVLHRDLKPRNVLLDHQLTAKLTDLGMSRHADSRAALTAGVGSSRWMAPEVMLGESYDAKSDVFSLGVVLSELDTHELLYAHAQALSGDDTDRRALPEPALLQLVAAGQLEVQFSRACAPEMQTLARQCLRVAPSERPSAAEVLYQLHVVLRSLESVV